MADGRESQTFLCGILSTLSRRKLTTVARVELSQIKPLCEGLRSRSDNQAAAESSDHYLAGRDLWELSHSPHYEKYAPGRNPEADRHFVEGLRDGYAGVRGQKSPDYLSGHKLGKETRSLSMV